MGKTDDSQLVARAAGGDAEALTELVRRYRDMVYGYCYHRTGSFEDARDLSWKKTDEALALIDQVPDSEVEDLVARADSSLRSK